MLATKRPQSESPARGRRPMSVAGRPTLSCLLSILLLTSICSAAPERLAVTDLGADGTVGRDLDAQTGRRYWSWGWGGLVVDDPQLEVEEADGALHLDCGPSLRGMSDGRRLRIEDGSFGIDSPLLLCDDGFQLFVGSGRLTIDGTSIRVGQEASRDRRADLLIFLGLLLLTLVLLRNARRKTVRK